MQEMPWEIMVAQAAPATPISNTKIKIGSSTMLHTAPISTENMPIRANPWALIKALSPSASSTNTVPME